MESFTRAGLTFDVTDRGPRDGPVVLLLHGFPQSTLMWETMTPELVAAGLRVVAFDQRGYSPRARPAGNHHYVLRELVADAATLIDTLQVGPVHVLGHDWGAAVAWGLAGWHPDLLRTLTAVSVPHPSAMLGAALTSTQALSSSYIGVFQLPWLPERILAPDHPAGRWLLARFLRASGQSPACARRDVDRLHDTAGLAAALAWYRALPLGVGTPPPPPSPVPTLFVWSDGDTAITRRAAELTARHVTGPYQLQVLHGVSHWIPDQAPHTLATLLLAHTTTHL